MDSNVILRRQLFTNIVLIAYFFLFFSWTTHSTVGAGVGQQQQQQQQQQHQQHQQRFEKFGYSSHEVWNWLYTDGEEQQQQQ